MTRINAEYYALHSRNTIARGDAMHEQESGAKAKVVAKNQIRTANVTAKPNALQQDLRHQAKQNGTMHQPF
jgi:hypothetical protein